MWDIIDFRYLVDYVNTVYLGNIGNVKMAQTVR